MYVHLGEDILVRTRDIIAIIDKESVNTSQYFEEFLEGYNQSDVHLTNGTFKSIVVTKDKVYYSPLASGTLKKRSSKLSIQEIL